MKVTLVLRITRGGIDAQLVRRRRIVWAGAASYERPEDVADAIAQIAAEESLPVRPCRLRVVLEPPLAQVRELRGLPPVRRPALRSLVALQAGRFFRRNGKRLITDAAWAPRARGADRIARAAAVEEPWLDAIATGARAAGLWLETVTAASAWDTVLELIPPEELLRRRRAGRLAIRRLGTMAVLLWVGAAVVVLGRLAREHRRIEREMAVLVAPAKALITARQRLREMAQMVEAITDAERGRHRVAMRVAAIVGTLPDSSYLTSLAVDTAGGGSLTGAAKQAAAVMAALDRAGVVEGGRLVGPTVREVVAGREWERFTLGFGRVGVP